MAAHCAWRSHKVSVAIGMHSQNLWHRITPKLVKESCAGYCSILNASSSVCNHTILEIKSTGYPHSRFLRPNVKSNGCFHPSVKLIHRTSQNETQDERNNPPPQGGRRVKPVFVAIPNPLKVIRNWCFGVIIRAYFDPEFSFKDFTEGAKQGLSIISSEMATGQLDNIQNLVSPKLLPELQNIIGRMTLKDRTSLAVSAEDVLYSFPHNITVHYDDKGGKFLYILMRFWCLTSYVPSEESEVYGFKVGSPPPGVSEEEFRNMGSVISCTYEFLREVTPGVAPEWTVTHIQHGKLINTEARGFPPS